MLTFYDDHELISREIEKVLRNFAPTAPTEVRSSAFIEELIDSQTNPFSIIPWNTGSIEQVRQSSLRALARLYPRANRDHQTQIEKQLIAASRDANPIVRRGVAMALKEIENSDPLPVHLLLPLVVLLHDPDPNTCAWACVASANLITRGMATPFNDHLLERLLNLADTSPIVQVRVGAAIGLRLVGQSNLLDRETTQRS